MKISLKKAVISIGTAVVMVTSVFAGTVVAASTNEITVKPSAFSVGQNEAFDVAVNFESGDNGASGFQLYLHYDSSKLDVYVPDTNEIENGKYNVGSRFSVVTNYEASSDTVKIVGANLSANNITVNTPLSLVTFVPKENASGKAAFWIEVEKLVENKNNNMVSTSYSAPTASNPVYVNILAPAAVVTTTTEETTTTTPAPITTTTVSTTPAPVPTTTEAATTSESGTTTKKSETVTSTSETTAAPETTTASSDTTENTSSATSETPSQTAPDVTSAATADTSAAGSETTSATAAETTVPVSSEPQKDPEVTTGSTDKDTIVIEGDTPLYEYSQGNKEYNEAEVTPYSVDLKNYIDNFETGYDIKVSISSDGYANGSISMNDPDGNWVKYYQDTQSDVWEASNIRLDKNDALVFVQLFYLEENSDFAINKIELSPYDAASGSANVQNVDKVIDNKNHSSNQFNAAGGNADPEKVEELVNDMPKNDNNPKTSDSTKSILAVSLVILEIAAMGATLFFTGRKKVEEPIEE